MKVLGGGVSWTDREGQGAAVDRVREQCSLVGPALYLGTGQDGSFPQLYLNLAPRHTPLRLVSLRLNYEHYGKRSVPLPSNTGPIPMVGHLTTALF